MNLRQYLFISFVTSDLIEAVILSSSTAIDVCEDVLGTDFPLCKQCKLAKSDHSKARELLSILAPGIRLDDVLEYSPTLSPFDGLILSSWISLYVLAPESSRKKRLEELKSFAADLSMDFIAAVFSRYFRDSNNDIRECGQKINRKLRRELDEVDTEIDVKESEIESLSLEYNELETVFGKHVEKFYAVNSAMRNILKGLSSPATSPDFKAISGFEVYKARMMTLVSKLNEATDKQEISRLEDRILLMIRDLKQMRVSTRSLWKICKEPHENIVDRSQDRFRLRSLDAQREQRRAEIAMLEKRREILKKYVSED
jgi:hypothetical protein